MYLYKMTCVLQYMYSTSDMQSHKHTLTRVRAKAASCSRVAAVGGGTALLAVVRVLPLPHPLGGQLVSLQQAAVLIKVV